MTATWSPPLWPARRGTCETSETSATGVTRATRARRPAPLSDPTTTTTTTSYPTATTDRPAGRQETRHMQLHSTTTPAATTRAATTTPTSAPAGRKATGQTHFLDRIFKLSEHKTDIRTEIVAGLTTFLTMAYIIFVNPSILSAAGM